MKKILFFLMIISSGGLFAQQPLIKLNANRGIEFNSSSGSVDNAVRININNSNSEYNYIPVSNLILGNQSIENKAWNALSFKCVGRYIDDNSYNEMAAVRVQTYYNESAVEYGDLHIATAWDGYSYNRFSVYGHLNYTAPRYNFRMGKYASEYRGVWIDDVGGYQQPTIRPTYYNSGYLGTPNNRWKKIYTVKVKYKYYPTYTSDKRLKKNIKNIDSSVLSKIVQLQGVSYNFKQSGTAIDFDTIPFIKKNKGSTDPKVKQKIEQIKKVHTERIEELKKEGKKKIFGFIAQDVEKVFPEIVGYNEERDRYALQYTALLPLLVEAVKEQQKQIEQVDTEIESRYDIGEGVLYQTSPSPSNTETVVRYKLPETVGSAALSVCDMQGEQLKVIELFNHNSGSVVISGLQFEAGMYQCTLIAYGKEVDTKRMILTEE